MKKFSILRNKKPMMSTDSISCIDDYLILKQMQKAGYTFRVDGKTWKLSEANYKALKSEN